MQSSDSAWSGCNTKYHVTPFHRMSLILLNILPRLKRSFYNVNFIILVFLFLSIGREDKFLPEKAELVKRDPKPAALRPIPNRLNGFDCDFFIRK